MIAILIGVSMTTSMVASATGAAATSGAGARVAHDDANVHQRRALRHAAATVTVNRAAAAASGRALSIDIHVPSTVFGGAATTFTLALEPYTDLFSSGYKHIVIGKDGDVVKEADAALPKYFYRTAASEQRRQDTALLFIPADGAVDTVEGSVYAADGRHFYIQPAPGGAGGHVAYLQSELREEEATGCGVDDDDHHAHGEGHGHQHGHGHAHAHHHAGHGKGHSHGHEHTHEHTHEHVHHDFATDVATPALRRSQSQRRLLNGKKDKYVEMLAVNDHALFEALGAATQTRAAAVIANVAQLYANAGATFNYNLNVQLVAQVTFAHGDPYGAIKADTENGAESQHGDLLSKFNEWRVVAEQEGKIPPHDNAQLLSGLDFSGGTVGYAPIGALCSSSNSVGVNQAWRRGGSNAAEVAATVAHEFGHNLGMWHNNRVSDQVGLSSDFVQGQCMTSSDYIMNPSGGGTPPTSWSACAGRWLNTWFEGYSAGKVSATYGDRWHPKCAEASAPRVWTADPPVCGDGLREGDEQCDCGVQDCAEVDPCCDGATCRLKAGSTCSAADPCCEETGGVCRVTSAGAAKVCRAASTACDLPETCNGSAASCPADVFKATGTSCTTGTANDADGLCHAGGCHSHKEQCNVMKTKYGFSSIAGTCPWRNEDDGAPACGDLLCSSGGNSCFSMSVGSNRVRVEDGAACGGGKVCYSGGCIEVTDVPGVAPTPTAPPTSPPVASPTKRPTTPPTPRPTTKSPTRFPTRFPTTRSPTAKPTRFPTTKSPTKRPTPRPSTASPTPKPVVPTRRPTPRPTSTPTAQPTQAQTEAPTADTGGGEDADCVSIDARAEDEWCQADCEMMIESFPTWCAWADDEPEPQPTRRPTPRATRSPTRFPTTKSPTKFPTRRPTTAKPTTAAPTAAPVAPTSPPTHPPSPNYFVAFDRGECSGPEVNKGRKRSPDACWQACKGTAGFFIYGNAGTRKCNRNGCACFCETAAPPGASTCNIVGNDDYSLYLMFAVPTAPPTGAPTRRLATSAPTPRATKKPTTAAPTRFPTTKTTAAPTGGGDGGGGGGDIGAGTGGGGGKGDGKKPGGDKKKDNGGGLSGWIKDHALECAAGGGALVAICAFAGIAWRCRPGEAQRRERAELRRNSRRLGGDVSAAIAEINARCAQEEARARGRGPWPTNSGRLPGGRTVAVTKCAVCGKNLKAKLIRARKTECGEACRRVAVRIAAGNAELMVASPAPIRQGQHRRGGRGGGGSSGFGSNIPTAAIV